MDIVGFKLTVEEVAYYPCMTKLPCLAISMIFLAFLKLEGNISLSPFDLSSVNEA